MRWVFPHPRVWATPVVLGRKNCQPSWRETDQRGGCSRGSDGEEGNKMGSSWDYAEPLLSSQQGLKSVSSPDGGKREQL